MSTECKRCGNCCQEFFLPPLKHMHEPPLWVTVMLMNIQLADVTDCDDEPCMFFIAELDDALAECVIHDKTWRPSICQRFSCEGDCSGLDNREEEDK